MKRILINILFEGMTYNQGGLETFIINIYNKMDKSKFQCFFIAYDEKIAYENYLIQTGAKVLRLPPRCKGIHNYCRALIEIFKQNSIDIIWSNKSTLSSCESLIFAKKFHVPIRIIHGHSSGNMGNWFTYIMHCTNRIFIRYWTTEQFACSELAARWFFRNHKAHILRNAVDLKSFKYNSKIRKDIHKELGISGKKVIGHVGRFGLEKNHTKLIHVFKKLHDIDSNTVLVLCGDGEEREHIEKLIHECDLEGYVYLLGIIDNVNEILQGIDIFVMPSLFEGLPFALLEAQASGLKCVVSDTVSRESDVLGWNQFLSLDASDDIWARMILEINIDYDREEGYRVLKEKGYDIEDNVHLIEKIILKEV